MVQHSICITCCNEIETIRQSLDSILNQIDNTFEIVVVDSHSDDGSLDVLSEYAKRGTIKLIVKKCNRGMGRQTAFENSSGEFIISHMDLDDIFKPELKELLGLYHAKFEDCLLYVSKRPNSAGITIGSRELIARIGGWRSLQYSEDWDLWARAAKLVKFKVLNHELRKSVGVPDAEIQSFSQRFKYRCIKYREHQRLGRKVFVRNERVTLTQKLCFYLACITRLFYPSFRDPFNKSFNPWDEKYRAN